MRERLPERSVLHESKMAIDLFYSNIKDGYKSMDGDASTHGLLYEATIEARPLSRPSAAKRTTRRSL